VELSTYALENMGFEKILESCPIEAKFQSLNVYEIRGIKSNCESVLNPSEAKVTSGEITVSIGESLNSICNTLLADDFADDELAWCSEKKAKPPFLMIHTSLQEYEACATGYQQKNSEEINTYECFDSAKEKIRQLEKDKTYPYVSALSACLSTPDRSIAFIPLDRIEFGTTPEHITVRDIRFEINANMHVSSDFSMEEVKLSMTAASTSLERIHPKVGYFFDLATRENDTLKKFLYYFLAIEVHTHQVYRKLDYLQSFSSLNNLPSRVTESATSMLVNYQKEAKNLAQRFVWCSILSWGSITDEDIKQFKILKKYRDHIYHGEDVDTKSLPLHAAKNLILKIMKDEISSKSNT
jgi:hypothetical protein